MTNMPKAINDLARHTAPLSGELLAAAGRVVRSGWFVLGSEVTAFESEFARYCGVGYCVSMANGTDALELAMRALGVRSGMAVATTANSGMYSSAAIASLGAVPRFVEIEESTMLMDAAALRSAELGSCAAAIVTHLYGKLADVGEIGNIASASSVPLIEDCAQSHGAALEGRRCGSFGAAGCFSFYPTKNLGALGDGGAVVTDDGHLAGELRKLRQYGWSSKYHAEVPGGRNSRLDEMQAAFLREKLKHLDEWNARRREVANRYRERICNSAVRLPPEFDGTHAAHLFIVSSPRRDMLFAYLKSRGVPVDIHYPLPDYRQPALGALGPFAPLGRTERACASVLTLPCFPEMTAAEVDEISAAVNDWPVDA